MSRDAYPAPTDLHQECWALLPWIVNERATRKDLARIDGHLQQCSACQEELATQRQLRDALRSEDSVMLAPQASLQKLLRRIDQVEELPESAAARAARPRAKGKATAATARWPWLSAVAAVQGVTILALITALWLQSREVLNAPRFTTLTTQQASAAGAVIRVVFAGQASVGEIAQLLQSIDAQILAGPTDAGVYTLGLSRSAQVPAALATLRADSRVRFAEAALARSGPR